MREGNFHARRRTCRDVEHLTGGWGLRVLSVGHLTLQNAASACSRATRTLSSRNRPLCTLMVTNVAERTRLRTMVEEV
jgi:hypothetical protein